MAQLSGGCVRPNALLLTAPLYLVCGWHVLAQSRLHCGSQGQGCDAADHAGCRAGSQGSQVVSTAC